MEPLILHIETSTKTCSVCISRGHRLLALKEQTDEKYSHAEKLTPFIQEVAKEAGIKLQNLDAIAISEGPGSYTGLRIGTSTAKGIAYSINAKLIAIPSLEILAQGVVEEHDGDEEVVVPMIDARRDEVYTATYDMKLNLIEKTHALIIGENALSDLRGKRVYLSGDGAKKGRHLLENKADFEANMLQVVSETPSAIHMINGAMKRWEREDFEDLAYFEPFYLKAFMAGKPKKLL